MVEVFDNLYTSIKGRSRAKSFLRFTVRILANIILPIYLSWQKIFKQSRKINQHALLSNEKIIVSMTTFPKRIKKLWMVIETMRRQTVQPDKIVLWLSEEQFPNKVNDIPNNLQWYVNIGFLEIKFVSGDLRSHKKYYYSFQEYSNDIIIIIDDDIFYKKTLIAELMNAYIANDKGCVCAHRGYDVTRSSTSIEPYRNWIKSSTFNTPSSAIFHTSGGGTLYKAEFFDKRVLDYNVFKDICFHADDIWLNVMLQLKGTKTVLISSPSVLLPVLYKNDVTLSSVNVSLNKNDEQLKLLFQHYNIKENEVFNM